MFRAMSFLGELSMPLFQTTLQGGQLEVWQDDGPLFTLGDGNGPNFIVRVNGPGIFNKILQDPDLTLGETYVDEKWDLIEGDLGQFLSWIVKNHVGWITKMPTPAAKTNDPMASEKNVAHHYDLGNDLYQSFLDEGMNYSCAFFNDHRMSFRDAQLNKIYTTLERMRIGPGMKVLEIGCGWGELCRILSRSAPGIEVTGLTLSENQVIWADGKNKTVRENPPKFIFADYRDHAQNNPGSYDRIVSIGMFEHIGREYYSTFFQAVHRLLKPGGRAVIHSIMRPEFGSGTSRWLDSYIFPSGCIPYLPEALQSANKEGLKISEEPFIHPGSNYAETLRRWRRNFHANASRLSLENYDMRFRRIWDFYLAICEASFDGFGHYVTQMVFEKE